MDNISPRPDVERDRATVVRGGAYESDPKTSMVIRGKKKKRWSGYALAAIGIVAAFAVAVAALYVFAPSDDSPVEIPKAVVSPVSGKEVAPKAVASPEVRIAAFTAYGEYRAVAVSDWMAFSPEQCSSMRPVGAEVSAGGHKFIVALDDAAKGEKLKWAESNDSRGISKLDDVAWDEGKAAAKADFGGKANTKAILDQGESKGIAYPAARAADAYYVNGTDLDWYLPASGQLWAVCESRSDIEKALRLIGGAKLSYYWSSTEENASNAWYANVEYANLLGLNKDRTNRVRAVADVPR